MTQSGCQRVKVPARLTGRRPIQKILESPHGLLLLSGIKLIFAPP